MRGQLLDVAFGQKLGEPILVLGGRQLAPPNGSAAEWEEVPCIWEALLGQSLHEILPTMRVVP